MSSQKSPHSKLDAAGLLILGMESLRARELMPVSKAAVEAATTLEAAVDRQRIATALSCAVLSPIVVELVVKHLWEQELGRTAPHHHNVHRLYLQLDPNTRRDIAALYDRCCLPYREAVDAGRRQHGAAVVAVDLADLDQALRWNKQAVTDLKYEMAPRGKSVPTGMFWSTESIWVAPEAFPVFAVELTRWAVGRGRRTPSP